jgi:DNA invertase Pin-like site-specific DNA recombinase
LLPGSIGSTRDLLNLLGTLADKGAGFKSLKDTWADTTTAHGRLMLTILGGLAEFERELIRTRTGEGRERAKAIRKDVEQHVLAHLPADLLAKLRDLHARGIPISTDNAFFHFGGGMAVRNL